MKIYILLSIVFLYVFHPADVHSNGLPAASSNCGASGFNVSPNYNYRRAGSGPYNIAIGLCASLNSGISFKHFLSTEDAYEIVLGTRWKGISLTGLYERCISTGTSGAAFLWSFGAGPRVGFYNGGSYKDYLGLSREPRTYSMIGFVGTFGFEYYFSTIPITMGVEYRPFFDLKGEDDSILDAVATIRFAF